MSTYYTDANSLTQKLITVHEKKSDICYHEHYQDRFKSALEKNLSAPEVSEFTKIVGGLIGKLDQIYMSSYEQGSYSGKLREEINSARDEMLFTYCRKNTELVGLLLTQIAQNGAWDAKIKNKIEAFISEQLAVLAEPSQTFLHVAATDRARLTKLFPRSHEISWGQSAFKPGVIENKLAAAGLEKYHNTTGNDRPTPETPRLSLNFTRPFVKEDLEALCEFNELQDELRTELQELQTRIQDLTPAQCKFTTEEANTYPVISAVKCRLAPGVAVRDIDPHSHRYADMYIIDKLRDGAQAVRRHGVTQGGLASDTVIYISNPDNIQLLKEPTAVRTL